MQATAGTIVTRSVSAPNLFINKQSAYTVTFTTVNNLVLGSFVTIQLPAQLSAVTANGCTSNVTGATCTITSANNITLNITANVAGGTQFSVNLANVTNGQQALQTDSFSIHSYYLKDDYQTLVDSVIAGLTVTLQANQINSPVITPATLVTFQKVNYNFSMTLSDPIPIGGFIVIQFPA